MRVAVLCSSSSCAALCEPASCVWRCVYTKSVRRARPGCLAARKTLAKGHIYGASYPRRTRVVFLLLDAAARRSGHARALGVVVVVVVDLLRAVLADLHEEGVELRHHERDPDSEACVRHYRAGVASMAWGWTRCPVPLTVDAKLIAARRRLAEIYDREDHECDVEAGVPVAVAAIVNAPVAAEEEGLRGRRLGGGPRRWRASDAVDAPLQL